MENEENTGGPTDGTAVVPKKNKHIRMVVEIKPAGQKWRIF